MQPICYPLNGTKLARLFNILGLRTNAPCNGMGMFLEGCDGDGIEVACAGSAVKVARYLNGNLDVMYQHDTSARLFTLTGRKSWPSNSLDYLAVNHGMPRPLDFHVVIGSSGPFYPDSRAFQPLAISEISGITKAVLLARFNAQIPAAFKLTAEILRDMGRRVTPRSDGPRLIP